MSGATFHNPPHNQLHSPRHMCCGDVTIKVILFYLKKWLLFLWVGVNTFTFLCVWYKDRFTQMKRSNAHEVTLRAVLEMLFCVFMSSLRRHAHFSVCVQKESACFISCIISACEQSIAGSRSVKEISCTTACHSTAALLQTATSTSILTLHIFLVCALLERT